ncbi:hypothetical protein GUJ93_ZPchr2169g6441 [Zizania palustris]|uniref:Uncharacterized protein n=1 Tax=Zizania palustris TaxID=103762 RepID=A0A8J5VEA6_ZIZPA|nr:hypothetical protein GUJ93_ZPchr2169g6441 [Zizania palustris]
MEKALTKIGNSLAPRRPSRSSPPLATISLLVYVLYVLVSLGEDGQGKKKPYVLASFDPRQVRRLHRLCSSGVVPPLSTMVSYWHLHPSRVSRADSLFETEVETLTEALESANNVVLSTISMIFVTINGRLRLVLMDFLILHVEQQCSFSYQHSNKVALRLVRPAKKVIVEKAHKTVVP